jgi:3-oxoacyl-[acyl-carrier protein] reductase
MSFEINLCGRRALVTGSGQGVGRAIVLAMARAGGEVIVNDVESDRATAVVCDVRAAGGRAEAAVFDVTEYAAVVEAVRQVGPVHILINNAGNAGARAVPGRGWFVDSEPAEWEPYLRVNLYGVMNCCRAVLPAMIESRWGRIVTIVSDAGRTGGASTAAYAAAKAGAAGLMRALAVEGGRHGVTANSISLGTMHTPTTDRLWSAPDSDRAKRILRGYTIRRAGLPEDVAPLAVLLSSDQAAWVTGQTYPVNGGYSFAL